MSEITISTGHPDAGRIYAEALDRVTAERDAALASLDSADASAQALHEVIARLQQRLTAADERADVLEGLLNKAHPFTYGLKGEQADLWLEIFNALLKP